MASVVLAGCGGAGSDDESAPSQPSEPTTSATAPTLPSGVTPIVSGLSGSDICAVVPATPSGYWVLGCSGTVTEVTQAGEKAPHARLDDSPAVVGALQLLGGKAVLPIQHGVEGEHLTYAVGLFDTATGTVSGQAELGDSAIKSVDVIDDVAYVATFDGDIVAYQPTDPNVVAVTKFPKPLNAASAGAGAVWGVSGDGVVSRFVVADKTTGSFTDKALRKASLSAVVQDDLWVASVSKETLAKVGKAGTVTALDVPGSTISMATCGDSVWLAQSHLRGKYGSTPGLKQLSLDGSVKATYEVKVGIGSLACASDGSVVGVAGDGTLVGAT